MLCGSPIGNAADASPRLRDALADADVIAAEDTRRLRRLCADLDVRPSGRVVSFFEANEAARVPVFLDALRARSGDTDVAGVAAGSTSAW